MSQKNPNRSRGELQIGELYEALVEAVDDVIFVVGPDGRYRMFNERGLKPFGFTPDRIIGKTPSEAFGSLAGERFEANNGRVLATKKPVQLEEWLTIEGRTRCYSTVLSPIFGEGGDVAAVVGIGRDVTDMKRMSEELETYAREMESIVERRVHYERLLTEITRDAIKRQPLSEFLRSVVALMGDAMNVGRSYLYEYDERRRIVSCAHEWTAPGIEPSCPAMQNFRADSQPWAFAELVSGRPLRVEDAARTGDDEFRAMAAAQGIKSMLVVPIFAFGNPFGFVGFDECLLHRHWEEMDVELLKSVGRIVAQTVERRRLEGEILRAERLTATGRLAASVAHEINNPLQAIMLHLDAIRDHVDSKRRRNLDFVLEGLKRIAGIISRLLGLYRTSKKVEEVDVSKVVEDAFRLVANQLTIKGNEARLELARGLPSVTGDSEQLYQVFLNLILNASDSMEGGGVIEISTYEEGGYVVVEVEDAGHGIDEESLPYVFEPFFSTKERSGTGLGLFVSHAIVADHGGRMDVESKTGEGTTIRVLLPVAGTQAKPLSTP